MKNKQINKLIEAGGNIVSMKAAAEICADCGERLYSEGVVRSFGRIREKLKDREFSHFKVLGQSFTVAENWPDEAIGPAG